ncbi:MAG: hypothetical protein QOH61_574 [Chloroflexota bacterium]|jgi:hypothetical protein|nr:hypothetical protein [Chloroflexota bacterium]
MSPTGHGTAAAAAAPAAPIEAGHAALVGALTPEWARLELLAACLLASRRGDDPPQAALDDLARRQQEVTALRGRGTWDPVTGPGLDAGDLDVLATALCPAVSPRAAALFATIVPNSADGTATVALVQELFALTADELAPLVARLRPGSALAGRSLISPPPDSDPRRPVRPAPGVLDAILGSPDSVAAPPGSIRSPGGVTFDDLIVSPGIEARLREFVTVVRNHHRLAEWGARPIGGPLALFAGPSGVGKSLAARAVAAELGWPLFRVDLSLLVDKYIGETEKNFTLLFDAAHGRRLVLHFEEAESLFGKRGEIREARDRYANLEVSHLLSRIEVHEGPCILSTNLRRNLDTAFLRRFQTVVEFQRPDRRTREKLWRRLLPGTAHLAGDVDQAELAAVELTGGEIHNAAVTACLLAAGDPPKVDAAVIAVAVWRELGKDGRPLHPRDLGPLAAHLPRDVRRADTEAVAIQDAPMEARVA